MSDTSDTKGQRRKALQNEATRRKISLGPISVDEIRYKRGIRVSTSREFRSEDGDIVPNTGLAQAILVARKLSEMHRGMILQAERCLNARGEETLTEFQQRSDDRNNPSEDPFGISIPSVNWSSSITQKYGSVSEEHFAADFLLSWDHVIRTSTVTNVTEETLLWLCQAWHFWKSECDGEHMAAARDALRQANLQKAGPARTGKRARRAIIVREVATSFWATRPNYRLNARKTAEQILGGVNERMEGESLGPYTLSTLVKAVGPLVKANKFASC